MKPFEYLYSDVQASLCLLQRETEVSHGPQAVLCIDDALGVIRQAKEPSAVIGLAWRELARHWQKTNGGNEHFQIQLQSLLSDECQTTPTTSALIVSTWMDSLADLAARAAKGLPPETFERPDRDLLQKARSNLQFESDFDIEEAFRSPDVLKRMGVCLHCVSRPDTATRFRLELTDRAECDSDDSVRKLAKRALLCAGLRTSLED